MSRHLILDGSPNPQGYSWCPAPCVYQSDRDMSMEMTQQGWMWAGARNPQTVTQAARQAEMMMHLGGPGHELGLRGV